MTRRTAAWRPLLALGVLLLIWGCSVPVMKPLIGISASAFFGPSLGVFFAIGSILVVGGIALCGMSWARSA